LYLRQMLNDGTKISSPFLMSVAIRAAYNADVPE
jgi:hypothetical protein